MIARLKALVARALPHRRARIVPQQRYMERPWDDLGGTLVGVHLSAATHPGFLIGHSRKRKRRTR